MPGSDGLMRISAKAKFRSTWRYALSLLQCIAFLLTVGLHRVPSQQPAALVRFKHKSQSDDDPLGDQYRDWPPKPERKQEQQQERHKTKGRVAVIYDLTN